MWKRKEKGGGGGGKEQQRRKMEEWKKLGKISRQKLEMESAGFVSCRPHARKWWDWN
jgi:hypothetical protein